MGMDLQIVISAITKGADAVKTFATELTGAFNRGAAAVTAFNKAAGDGRKAVAAVQGQVRDLIAAFAGFKAITNAVSIMKAAELGSRGMAGAVAAANKEFKNIGSLEDWEATVRKLSGELVIYSDTALKKAAAGTIDMTKYLGLSGDQMAEIVRRSGDLAAGKTELGDAIEKVVAAMRGEARGAGQLGLVLRDAYVKGWYEAHRTTAQAWEDLTELEKVQVRYNLFLEQTNTKLGKAAGYARTFAGGIETVRTQIENAVTRNRELMVAVNELGAVLREHAGEIGAMVAKLVEFLAWLIKVGVEYKNWILTLAGSAVAFGVLGTLAGWLNSVVMAVRGLNAAWVALTGSSVLSWLADARAALNGVAAGATFAGAAVRLFVAAWAAWGIEKIVELIKIIVEWRRQEAENQKIAQRSAAVAEQYKHAITEEHKARLAALKTKIESGRATAAEAAEYRNLLKDSIQYTGGLLGQAVAKQKLRGEIKALESEQAGYIKDLHAATDGSQKFADGLRAQAKAAPLSADELGKVQRAVEALGKSYGEQEKRVSAFYDLALERARREAADESSAAAAVVKVNEEKLANLISLAEAERNAALAVIRDKVKNEDQAAGEIAKVEADLLEKKKGYYRDAAKELQSSLERAVKQERDYAEQVKSHRAEAARIEQTTAETIRELRRKGMTEAEQFADREKEIAEKRAALRAALTARDYKAAKEVGTELVNLYKEQYSGAAASGKDAKAIQEQALAGIKGIGDLMAKSERDQAEAADEKRAAEAKRIEDLSTKLDGLTQQMTRLSQMEIAPTLAIDTTALDALIAKLDAVPKEIRTRHVIEEVSLAAKRFGGFIRALAGGGGIPGWGGGDRVRALLEPGEWVIRKEAVRRYGAGLFELLNSMRLELPRILAGSIPSLPPRLAYAGGGLGTTAGGTERLEIRFSAGGKVFPVKVQDKEDIAQGRALVEELNRGEYGPPY